MFGYCPCTHRHSFTIIHTHRANYNSFDSNKFPKQYSLLLTGHSFKGIKYLRLTDFAIMKAFLRGEEEIKIEMYTRTFHRKFIIKSKLLLEFQSKTLAL